jgi:predicted ATPase/class 3 adenylate cyclase/Tfp pilus assembly protein PilF
MARQPSGTVTFLFTDIEGSTRLLAELGQDRYSHALDAHRDVLRTAFERHGGYEVDCEGDAFFVAFQSATEALAAAAEAQRGLAAHAWPDGHEFKVRMGLHTGEPLLAPPKYVGIDVHRAARVMAAGHGGQVLISQTTRELVGFEFELRDLGDHRLKDLSAPQRLCQLGDGEFPPLKSLNQTNLPAQPTPLVGRKRELRDVLDLLRRPDVRLLSLTGPGGTGKTRLALQTAADLAHDYPDGVWFVPLAPIGDPEFVVSAIAEVLDVRETPGLQLLEALEATLAEKSLLLLVDNFEHLLSAAPSIASLLATAPGMKLLVTSRARLALSGEHEYQVPSLAEEEALSLFAARARALKPDFELDEEVGEICRRLDGLPLALELAAARIKVLKPQQILERLERRFDLLVGGARDLPERQRTLRAAIGWSYELLDEGDRRLFERLAVFAGSFDLEAAESVCGAELDALSSLVDTSLLRQTEEGRFFLLETIREYGLELLVTSGEVEEVRRRHAEHFLAIAEAEESEVRGPNELRALRRLDSEHDNFRAVLVWAIEGRHTEHALRLVGALHPFWYHRASYTEGQRWAEAALALGDEGPLLARVKTLGALGEFATLQGDYESAERALDERLPLARRLDDPGHHFSTLTLLGHLAVAQGDAERARQFYEQALDYEERSGSSAVVWQSRSVALNNVGWAMLLQGELDDAQDSFERGLEAARIEGSRLTETPLLNNLARVALERREYETTCSLAEQSLEILRENRDSRLIEESLELLARAAAALGQPSRAARCAGAAAALRDSMRIATWFEVVPHEDFLDVARDSLGEAMWEREWREGSAMTLEQAVDYALESTD